MATQARSKIRSISPPLPRIAEQDIQEQIRARAYQLYDQRGKLDGYPLDDWLQAEAEILPEQGARPSQAA